jgi:hypothetical protein
MNFRHAAALALAGWYLMLPPWSSPSKFDDKAPLNQWEQANAYDSAAVCEKSRYDTVKDLLKGHAPNGNLLDQKTLTPETADYNARLYAAARCIASDDPRLKEKAGP